MKKIKIIMLLFFVLVVETRAMDLIWQKQPHSEQINQILFSSDLKSFISIANDKSLKLIDVHSGNLLDSINFDLNPKHIAYSNDYSELLITFKSKSYGSVRRYDALDFSQKGEISLASLLNDKISANNQEFIECHTIDFLDDVLLIGTGIYEYVSADHFYKGYLTLFNKLSGDSIYSVYRGGMITNLKISPDKQFIAFTTLYRSSEYQSPKIYKETEKTELILTDIKFSKFQVLRTDFKQEYEYVDTEIFNAINFSHDSKKLVTVTDEHHIFAYDVISGLQTDSIFACDCYGDMDVGFVYNNNNIITGTNNGKIYIWNLEWDINIDSFKYNDSPYITAIASSDKYNLYAIGDYEGKLSLLTSREFSDVKNISDNIVFKQKGNYIEIINNLNHQIQLNIFDILGNRVYESYFNQSQVLIDTENLDLSHGFYFIKAITNGKSSFYKGIKLTD